MNQEDPPRLVTLTEAARHVGATPVQLLTLLRAGHLTHRTDQDQNLRVDLDEAGARPDSSGGGAT